MVSTFIIEILNFKLIYDIIIKYFKGDYMEAFMIGFIM